jgi:hypothetical protein
MEEGVLPTNAATPLLLVAAVLVTLVHRAESGVPDVASTWTANPGSKKDMAVLKISVVPDPSARTISLMVPAAVSSDTSVGFKATMSESFHEEIHPDGQTAAGSHWRNILAKMAGDRIRSGTGRL